MINTLMLSSLEGLSSMSWLSMWMMMEMNTMAMCFIMSKELNEQKKKKMNSMKYFLVQMLASASIMVMIAKQQNNFNYDLMLMMCLMMKMGAWPFHVWYMSILESMKLEMKSFILIMTWQKLMPAMVISMMNMDTNNKLILMYLCLASLMLPVLKVKKMSNMSTMAVSSLNNNSWVMISALISMSTLMLFLLFYMLVLFYSLKSLSMNTKMMKKNAPTLVIYLLILANISGIPPFTAFWMKIMVVKSSLYNFINANIIVLMLMLSCLMIFLYLAMMTPYFFTIIQKSQNMMKSNKMINNNSMMIFLISIMSTMMIMS